MSTKYKELENILVCPVSRLPLRALEATALLQLMEDLQKNTVVSRQPVALQRPLSGAYQVVGQERYYPVMDGIIGLLPALAMMSPRLMAQSMEQPDQLQMEVQAFYDTFGWKAHDGLFQDAHDSEDLREVSQEYILHCHLRLNRFLPKHGQYLLDIASGPLQYDAYLTYSQAFDTRICADISITALLAAQQRLGDKGVYVLCDITQLPFKTDSLDAVVSLHTVYHVPKDDNRWLFLSCIVCSNPKASL